MLIHSRTRALVRSGRLLHLLKMADNKDAGPPPLEDQNSPDYVCLTCQNRVNSLCLANSTTNERDNSDSDMTDSAYAADTISDSQQP